MNIRTDIDPGVSPNDSWPIFRWLGEQVGNFQTLGVLIMVAILVFGVVKWVGGASSDNSRSQTGGKIMVFGAVIGTSPDPVGDRSKPIPVRSHAQCSSTQGNG